MEYGLIGEKLPHSFSAIIHSQIGGYRYELKELAPQELEGFMLTKDFKGINVTIPYKQAVMPYLDVISVEAAAIGAVNTVVNRDGKLYGYNTDIGGIKALINRTGGIEGEKVLILGTGGTSKTAFYAARGASAVYKVSRSGNGGALSYEEVLKNHTDASVIINTTPCGMYPHTDEVALDISAFKSLKAVIDVVYNPLRTRLVTEAQSRGINATGGLYMLVKQAVLASEMFIGTAFAGEPTDNIYKKLLAEKENVVLTGMPGSGKSTVGKILAERLGREFLDIDAEIVKAAGTSIPEIFENHGEAYFRQLETDVIKKLASVGGAVIATGGGAVLKPENIKALKQNGHIYFIDRPLESLLPTDDRPLSRSADAIRARYEERYEIYKSTADTAIDVNGNAESVADEIERRHFS